MREVPELGEELGRKGLHNGVWSRVMPTPSSFGYGLSEDNCSGTVLLNWSWGALIGVVDSSSIFSPSTVTTASVGEASLSKWTWERTREGSASIVSNCGANSSSVVPLPGLEGDRRRRAGRSGV